MKWGRKTVAVLLCAALTVASLSGCGQKKDMVVDESKEPVVLSCFLPMSFRENEGVNAFLQLIDEYNAAHDEVQIQIEGISIKDGYNEVLAKRLASGEGDDIFVVNADSVKGFVAQGYLYDLSGLPAYERLYPAAKEQANVEGLIYTVPLTMSAYGMYVNQDLLKTYGLEPPNDLDSWLACCDTLKANGVTPLALNRWYSMTAPVMARGLYKIYQADNYEELVAGLNDGSLKIGDQMLEGFELFEEMLDKGYYGDDLTREYVDGLPACTKDLDDFQNQTVAFAFFPCGVEKYFDDRMKQFTYEVQGIPALPDGTVCLPSIADRFCINANSEHLPEALAFAEFLTNANSPDILADGGGALPSREGQAGTPTGAEHMHKLLDLVEQEGQIPIEDMRLHFTYWDTVRILCLDMIDGMSAKEAAEKYNAIQMEQIEAYAAEKAAL